MNSHSERGFVQGLLVGVIALVIFGGGAWWVVSSQNATTDDEEIMEQHESDLSDDKAGAMMDKEDDEVMMEKDSGEAMMEEQEGDSMMEKEDSMMEGESMMEKEEIGAMEKPTYTGKVLAGNASKLIVFNDSDYQKALKSGDTVLLWYYANWCPTCKIEQESIKAAFNEFHEPGVTAFRVNINDGDTDDAEESTARKFGVSFRHTKVAVKNGERIFKTTEIWKKEHYLEQLNTFVTN